MISSSIPEKESLEGKLCLRIYKILSNALQKTMSKVQGRCQTYMVVIFKTQSDIPNKTAEEKEYSGQKRRCQEKESQKA